MKRIYIICLLAISTLVSAQNETMYVMKDGVIIYQKAVAEIDYITFEEPPVVHPTFTIDGNFDDWADIPEITGVEGYGSIQKVKVYGKGPDNIYIYIEGPGLTFGESGVHSDILFTIDEDNTNGKPEGQSHYESDGSTLTQFDIIYRTEGVYVCDGATNVWKGDILGYWNKSDLMTVGVNKAVEISIPKAQMKSVLGQLGKTLSTTGIRAAIWDRSSSWGLVGRFPVGKNEANGNNTKTTPFFIDF